MLFDWLITGQVIDANPAAAVRAAKHIVKKGKAPVLKADQTRELLDSISLKIGPEPKDGEEDNRPPSLIGLRDRALIAVVVFSFARVAAALGMKVEDYYTGDVGHGSACTRKAASGTRYPSTTTPRITSMPISRRQASETRRKPPCSAPSTGTAD